MQVGCPHTRNAPYAELAGTGGPTGNSSFKTKSGQVIKRDGEGNIPDEFTKKFSNEPYTLSMANTGAPNSGGSQFFINTVHNDFLDWWRSDLSESQHPVFGRVIDGKDVIKKIENVPTSDDVPRNPVKIISATVVN